jgi:flagellar biosynthesis/type III secretory pathway protein FliH
MSNKTSYLENYITARNQLITDNDATGIYQLERRTIEKAYGKEPQPTFFEVVDDFEDCDDRYDEGYEDGYQTGYEEGLSEGESRSSDERYNEGYADGYAYAENLI